MKANVCTMDVQRRPVEGEYVICSSDDNLTEEKLLLLGDFIVDRVPELENTYVARSKDKHVPDDLVRRKLCEMIGPHCKILNVLGDDDGQKFLPTGNISVLLTHGVSEAELSDWTANRNLTLISRSKWRPLAITVTPSSKTENLHAVVRALKDDPLVKIVEQDVLLRLVRE
ncbi:hypothetical protein [Leisingera caerulea]|uniref:hypothetical protein n=1 Tax=Leisingera caerulea TaxID=506591 RepID=UPI0021A6A971|nr:hypothetical protein [Leisingera caerulea]UWQ84379.1 hypothetical protein K3726_04055 [Leisingera caerulea]